MAALSTMTTRMATASTCSPSARATAAATSSRRTIRFGNCATKIASAERPRASASRFGPDRPRRSEASASVRPRAESVRRRWAASAESSVCQTSIFGQRRLAFDVDRFMLELTSNAHLPSSAGTLPAVGAFRSRCLRREYNPFASEITSVGRRRTARGVSHRLRGDNGNSSSRPPVAFGRPHEVWGPGQFGKMGHHATWRREPGILSRTA